MEGVYTVATLYKNLMKVVKSQVILYMYELLLSKKTINPKDVKTKFEIEDKTFLRYIQEIRAYYYNMYKTERIVYSKSMKVYFLVEDK